MSKIDEPIAQTMVLTLDHPRRLEGLPENTMHIDVRHLNGRVIVDFEHRVQYMVMTSESALQLAAAIAGMAERANNYRGEIM